MATSPAETRRKRLTYLRDIHSHETIALWSGITPEGAFREALEQDGKATGFDDIDVLETDEGDVITVNNEPVAYIDRGFTDRLAINEAVFPSRFLQAAE